MPETAPRIRLLPEIVTRPANAFVLSGGGSAGAAQVGMLRALLESGVKPDLVIGCSVGALNAAFLAVDPSLSRVGDLEGLWRSLDRRSVFGPGRAVPVINMIKRETHLYEPDGLIRTIRRAVPLRDLADTAIPCHIVTTDLDGGRPVFHSSGDPAVILAASACVPALFPPVKIDGRAHVDGGVSDPLPIDRAIELGAMTVWAFDVSGGSLGRRGDRMTALDVLLMSFAISRQLLNRPPAAGYDEQQVIRLPMVDVGNLDLRDFSRTGQLIAAGYESTQRFLAA